MCRYRHLLISLVNKNMLRIKNIALRDMNYELITSRILKPMNRILGILLPEEYQKHKN